ncbi:hypothetical protein CSA56_18790 [candidate division KSB3 bacterium]|uniref:Uncharacterized protein n=1 Tax=candidate division KSB3 bacterium TaxID=2044937 RepID=A0A2G6K911_9BACT|nr:MAG: hypothetical protein CSA56_18790 [candidate division KSB3 bacterium]
MESIVKISSLPYADGGKIEYQKSVPAMRNENGSDVIHLATGLVVDYPPCFSIETFAHDESLSVLLDSRVVCCSYAAFSAIVCQVDVYIGLFKMLWFQCISLCFLLTKINFIYRIP